MVETSSDVKETVDATVASDAGAAVASDAGAASGEAGGSGVDFSQRYGEVLGKVNDVLDKVDWSQVGRIGKAFGVILAVIVAQVLIKGVLDTINLLPIVPGLLELLGLVVVGTWSWNNLTTSEKRSAVVSRIQAMRREYLG